VTIIDLMKIKADKAKEQAEVDAVRIFLIKTQEELLKFDIKKHKLEPFKQELMSEIIRLSLIVAGEKEK
jgi:hypothetical protein